MYLQLSKMSLPPLCSFLYTTSPDFQKSPLSDVFLWISVPSGACTMRCSSAAVAYLAYAYLWKVAALLLLPGQSELLGWQGWDGARMKNCWMRGAWRCRISRLVSVTLVKRSMGRNGAGYGAASEGKKWTMVVLSRTPGWLGMGLLLWLQLLNYCYLQVRNVQIFGAGESVQAVTQVLPMQETRVGEGNTEGDRENEHH